MSTIFYAPGTGGYFANRFPSEPGKTVILFAHSEEGGFYVIPPPGVDWADYEARPDDADGKPVPAVRHPRDPWTYYQQTYPEIVGSAAQPDAEEANSWQPPEPEPVPETPVTDVDRARQYAEAYAAAEQIIFLLMGRVAPALVVGGFFTPETVNAEGTRFMAFHRDLIIDFKNSGRHPDAGTALYNAIAATPSTTAFPWLLANGGAILAIFGNGLPRNA